MRFIQFVHPGTENTHVINLDNVSEFVVGKSSVTYEFVDGSTHTFTAQSLGEGYKPLTEMILRLA